MQGSQAVFVAMCGRFECDGEFSPSDMVNVLTLNGNEKMRWGIVNPTARAIIINVRIETANLKPMFAQSFQNRRCVIRCEGYYEWGAICKESDQTSLIPDDNELVGKQRYLFTPADSTHMFMAGIYELSLGAPRFAVLTTNPDHTIQPIHHRMPVLLTSSDIQPWLESGVVPPSPELKLKTV